MEIIIIIGLIAAVLSTGAFLPQAIKTIKTRQVKDLSLGMYCVITTGIFLWVLYGIFNRDLPIILANSITLLFTFTILVFIIRYK